MHVSNPISVNSIFWLILFKNWEGRRSSWDAELWNLRLVTSNGDGGGETLAHKMQQWAVFAVLLHLTASLAGLNAGDRTFTERTFTGCTRPIFTWNKAVAVLSTNLYCELIPFRPLLKTDTLPPCRRSLLWRRCPCASALLLPCLLKSSHLPD